MWMKNIDEIIGWIKSVVTGGTLTNKELYRAVNREIKLKNTPKSSRTGRTNKIDKYFSRIEEHIQKNTYSTYGGMPCINNIFEPEWDEIIKHANKKLCRTSFYNLKKKIVRLLEKKLNQEFLDLYPDDRQRFKRTLLFN